LAAVETVVLLRLEDGIQHQGDSLGFQDKAVEAAAVAVALHTSQEAAAALVAQEE